MKNPFLYFADLAAEVTPPKDGTFSRTLYQDEGVKVVLFAFSKGQELSEHTSAKPAILHFLSGEADLTLGSEKMSAKAGTWVHMTPKLPHALRAKTPVTMLLLLLTLREVAAAAD